MLFQLFMYNPSIICFCNVEHSVTVKNKDIFYRGSGGGWAKITKIGVLRDAYTHYIKVYIIKSVCSDFVLVNIGVYF